MPDETVTQIDVWYDRTERMWTLTKRDARGYVVGEIERAAGRDNALIEAGMLAAEHNLAAVAVVITTRTA